MAAPLTGREFKVLFNDCMIYADRNGRIEDRRGTPISRSLKMTCSERGLHITFSAHSAAQGNGYCQVTVTLDGRVVLKGHGGFTAGPNNVKEEVRVPGDWEKRIPHYE